MCQPKSKGGKRCTINLARSARKSLQKSLEQTSDGSQEHSAILTKLAKLDIAESKYGNFVTPLGINLNAENKEILADLRTIGTPLIIGGFVRDHILEKENKDIDIEVHGADIDSIITKLRACGYHVDEVGKSYGVLKAKKRGSSEDYDISVPRLENNVAAGHRGFEVEFDNDMTVEQAAARRDFTFNAVMYDDELGVAIDPYHGMKDLESRKLKHVSSAFAEDPLRVLRAFQFAGRFDLNLDKDTATLCQELRTQLPTIADERIAMEWEKFYSKANNPQQAVKVLQKSGWDDLSPGLKESLKSKEINEALDYISKDDLSVENRTSLMAAVIGSKMSEADRQVFYRKTLVGSKAQKLAKTFAAADELALNESTRNSYSAKKFSSELQTNGFNFELYEKYSKALNNAKRLEFTDIAKQAGVYNKAEEPLLLGRNIIALSNGKKPGPWVGNMQRELLELQHSNKLTDQKQAEAWVANYKH